MLVWKAPWKIWSSAGWCWISRRTIFETHGPLIQSIILGPGNIDQDHALDEYVVLDQVLLAAEFYARTILEF
jgi:acetylornithine deacetylase/succinyl-diaminopimelate desuccinylase-like protein